jgi:hypothetical protein
MKYELQKITTIRKIEVETNRLITSCILRNRDVKTDKKACVCYVCKQKKKAKIKIRRAHAYLNVCAKCFKEIAHYRH